MASVYKKIPRPATSTTVIVSDETVSVQNTDFNAEFGNIYIVTGNADIQLPAPEADGQIVIKRIGSVTVNLLRDGAEEIDGVASNKTLVSTNESVRVVTDGTDYFLI